MRILVISIWLLWASIAQAKTLPIEEQTEEAVQWLAVAMIAEAGWKSEIDHRAIFHVLKNRWPRLNLNWPKTYPHFIDVVQNYVAVFDSRTEKKRRARWLIALLVNPDRTPPGWPLQASWPKHKVLWLKALKRAERCIEGHCSDPYKGGATHWGGDTDTPKGCMEALPNVGTLNTFYRVDMACKRRKWRGVIKA